MGTIMALTIAGPTLVGIAHIIYELANKKPADKPPKPVEPHDDQGALINTGDVHIRTGDITVNR